MGLIHENNQEIAKILAGILPKENNLETLIPGVSLFRTDKSFIRVPLTYHPRIILMAQGKKRVFIGEDTYTYDPSQYLVLSVPIPLECDAIAEVDKPILGFGIDVNPAEVAEILLLTEETKYIGENIPKGIYGAGVTEEISDASLRLMQTLNSKADSLVLGKSIVREIIYRVLKGENGDALQALAHRNRKFFQISQILSRIHKEYDQNLDIGELAISCGMSVSTFHVSFKAVTNSSPLQYIKSVRLQKARSLMITEGTNAITAAERVGYESPSQFSREYKRYFGLSPAKDQTKQLVQS
ncbi:AraC family transcriptional regulator [Leptospira meyeri]|uniref:AraC family transcriptional regulator n=1 Tax=Leptospira meyeri TaxID=29508 RepID=UPI0002BDFC2D|nr:AraC family transcriptional regulator [Leptospira meyeri]EMJ89302.1 AraC-type transcriptional regulator N-terminal domain protein [Leptospira meyeri serovar Semaranga str. Veldrot Semarang 173]